MFCVSSLQKNVNSEGPNLHANLEGRLHRTNSWTNHIFVMFFLQPCWLSTKIVSFTTPPCCETRAIMLWDFHASVHTRKMRLPRSKRQSRPWQNGSTIQGGIPRLLTSLAFVHVANVAIVQQELKNPKHTLATCQILLPLWICQHAAMLTFWTVLPSSLDDPLFFKQLCWTQRIKKNEKLACPGHLWACVECCAPLSARRSFTIQPACWEKQVYEMILPWLGVCNPLPKMQYFSDVFFQKNAVGINFAPFFIGKLIWLGGHG